MQGAAPRGPAKGLLKDTGSKSTPGSMGCRGEGDENSRGRGDGEEEHLMKIKEEGAQWG